MNNRTVYRVWAGTMPCGVYCNEKDAVDHAATVSGTVEKYTVTNEDLLEAEATKARIARRKRDLLKKKVLKHKVGA
jgi:hypothetical protein